MFDNMTFDEIEKFIDDLVNSREFDKVSKEFFSELDNKDCRKEDDHYGNVWWLFIRRGEQEIQRVSKQQRV